MNEPPTPPTVERRKRGRPQKTSGDALSARCEVCCTLDEEAQLCRLARAQRVSVSAYIRAQLKLYRILV